MWIPSLLKALEGDMQSKGLKLSAEDIYDINKSSLKDAIVQCVKEKEQWLQQLKKMI